MKSVSRLGRPASSLLRCVEREPSRRLPRWETRSFHGSAIKSQEKGKANEKDAEKGNLSFQGQLYQSTAERLKREKAAEAIYIKAQERQGPSAPGRTLGLSFSKLGDVLPLPS